jgi:hypothetical protein
VIERTAVAPFNHHSSTPGFIFKKPLRRSSIDAASWSITTDGIVRRPTSGNSKSPHEAPQPDAPRQRRRLDLTTSQRFRRVRATCRNSRRTKPTSLSARSSDRKQRGARTVPGAATPLCVSGCGETSIQFSRYYLRPDVLPWTCVSPRAAQPRGLPSTDFSPAIRSPGRDTRRYLPEFVGAAIAPSRCPREWGDHGVGFSRSVRIFSTRSRRRASSACQ